MDFVGVKREERGMAGCSSERRVCLRWARRRRSVTLRRCRAGLLKAGRRMKVGPDGGAWGGNPADTEHPPAQVQDGRGRREGKACCEGEEQLRKHRAAYRGIMHQVEVGRVMKRELIGQYFTAFGAITRQTEGVEYWHARDLQGVLGYAKWENFVQVIDRAKVACANSGQSVADHFADVGRMVDLGSGAQRQIDDVALTRYACYLIAQNGDPKKTPVAFAQTYFATQTRKQELIEQRLAEVDRLAAREKLTESERALSGIIFERVKDEKSFGVIRSKGDAALFGGRTTQEMKTRLGVPDGRPLADFLPTITIKAKDFANEITNFNIKEKGLKTEGTIAQEHVQNNKHVRKLLGQRGIVPEALPPAEDIKKVERRLAADAKTLPKQASKLPPGGTGGDGAQDKA